MIGDIAFVIACILAFLLGYNLSPPVSRPYDEIKKMLPWKKKDEQLRKTNQKNVN